MSEYMFDINVDVCYDLDQYDLAMIADLKAMKPGDQFEPLYEKYGMGLCLLLQRKKKHTRLMKEQLMGGYGMISTNMVLPFFKKPF